MAASKDGILSLDMVELQGDKLVLKCHIKKSNHENSIQVIESCHDTMEDVEQELNRLSDQYTNPVHDVTIIVDDIPGRNS